MIVHIYSRIDRLFVRYTKPSDRIALAVNLCLQKGFYEVYSPLSSRQFNSILCLSSVTFGCTRHNYNGVSSVTVVTQAEGSK